MKVKTHVKLAELAFIKNINNIPKGFSKSMFNFGLVMVDQSWLVKTHPHYMQHSLEYIKGKIKHLLSIKRFNGYHSIQLGVVVHYLCDFCCYSHINGCIGNISYHLKYEREIQKYLLENFDTFKKSEKNTPADNMDTTNMKSVSFSSIKNSIDNVLSNYINGQHSYLWDIKKCIEISSIVCSAVFALNFARNSKLHIVRIPNFIGKIRLNSYNNRSVLLNKSVLSK